jgi:peptidyl-dipeptidase Dcp
MEALERSGRALGRVTATFFNLVSSNATDAMQAVEREMAPALARHRSAIMLDQGLFGRVAALHARGDALSLEPDQLRLLERSHTSFTRAGAALDATGRADMARIAERLATLHTDFGQNVLRDETDWHMELAGDELDGLPDFARAAAAQAAAERGRAGHAITLSRSSVEPFLVFSTRRDLRQRAWRAWVARGDATNPALIREILTLRQERARLLGYPDFASYRLADSMAGSPDAAEALLRQVWAPARARAEAERAELEALAGHAIEPWDWRHYAERVSRATHNVDEAALKPYFPLDRMLDAAFDVAGRLFGLRFEERPGTPLYHADARAFEMTDAAGAHRGVFVVDCFARAQKRSGAWMSSFRDGETLDGPVMPIVINNNNIARAEPALLNFDEAETLFHEFGHALHGLLGVTRYPSQSGTSVLGDFVEFPSQVMEHWLSVPEILRTHARHHATGEALPEPLLHALLAARNAGQGFATVEFVSAALIDLALHRHPDPGSLDLAAFEADFLAGLGMPEGVVLRHRPPHFQHLFAGGGYAASYYAYMWAEVLDADGFEAFEEAGDPFDPALAARLSAVFSAGDSEAPMALYERFRGRQPAVAALLRQRGLDVAATAAI